MKLQFINIPDRPAFMKIVEINNDLIINGYILRINQEDLSVNIINLNRKEDNMTNEYIEGFAQRKAELEAEKQQLENADLNVIINERFLAVRDQIQQEVLAEHNAKIEDKDVEIRAIGRLIAREVAKLEAEQAVVENQESVEA